MRRVLLIIVSMFIAWQATSRDVININRNWHFFSNLAGSSDGAAVVNLPHTWNNDALGGQSDYFRGVGNYMKDMVIPLEWRNKRVFIRFNGAGTVTNFMVNGRHVGEHRGGYTAFTFEITSFLNYGEKNQLWAIVNNAPQMDVLPTAGDMNIYGGLYRDVELIVADPSMISLTDNSGNGVYLNQRNVSSEQAEVDAMIKIDGLRDRQLDVRLAVTTPLNDTVFFKNEKFKVPVTGKGQISIPIEMQNPHLWNGITDPYMYKVIVKLFDDGIQCDSIAVPLGLRSFAVDPKQGFMLNGASYPLRGVVYYEDRASVGNAISKYQVIEDLDMMVEMGVNAVRAAAYNHNNEFYNECDKRGIIVWNDIPLQGPAYMTDNAFVNMERFYENGRNQLVETIYQHYNNPSVVMWGLFSNLKMIGDDPTPYIEELNSIAMREDPSRMCVASSNTDGKINFVTDLISWDHTLGWAEGMPSDISLWLEQLNKNWGSLCSGISYGAGASIYHQEDSLYRPNHLGNWHPERWQTYLHEQYYSYLKEVNFLWGRFVSNMFDYGAAGRSWGDGTGIDDRGMVTFDRKYRKDAFYFYKANWNKNEPFVYIAEKRWNKRSSLKQTLKVYSNSPQVELFVNGVSMGVKPGIDGTFMWPEITLPKGINVIEARSDASIDHAQIEIDPAISVIN